MHKEKAAEKKGTQVKKNKVRGESNQEKDVGSSGLGIIKKGKNEKGIERK